jgi:hypothetical protein
MTNELTNLLNKYGLLPSNPYSVARPRLSKEERYQLAKIKKKYKQELSTAKQMRSDVLNITRWLARPRIIEKLLEEGHTEAAYLLTFNDEQIVLLLAYRDAEQSKPGSSSQSPKKKRSAVKAGSSSLDQKESTPKPKQGRIKKAKSSTG